MHIYAVTFTYMILGLAVLLINTKTLQLVYTHIILTYRLT